ncbi:hypothetical protein GTW25_08690 [Aliihoeflea aestuarii]|jgi:hypothetical protein|uniref:hypothetical protein n=1 Tax=Aliihoeflea aestuarii TaxID=453840 RepID=UPI00209288D5|nr:hypothetical protein [Aliihoeflea aestuarii]MCO6391104.1 hypothetical protein [Aliihoeflea aestuarii]
MNRNLGWKIIGGIVLMLAAVGTFNMTVWMMDRDPPITYLGARALTPVVAQGGTIPVEFDVFRHRICPIDVRRWLYDSGMNRHAIPSWTTGLELLAGREVYQRTITIPDAAASGPAQYQIVLDYECNPLARIMSIPIRVYSPPIRFEIKRR